MQTHNCWNNVAKRGVHVSASAMKLILSVFDNFILATTNLSLYGFWFSHSNVDGIWSDLKWNDLMISLSMKTLWFYNGINTKNPTLFVLFFHLQKPVQVDRRLDQGHRHQHPGQTSRSQRINVRPPMQHTTASTKPDASQWKLAIRCCTIASKWTFYLFYFLSKIFDSYWTCWLRCYKFDLLKNLSIFFSLPSRCTDGYMGSRCEYKDLDGSYLRKYFFCFHSHFPFFPKRFLEFFSSNFYVSTFSFLFLILFFLSQNSNATFSYAANGEYSEWCIFGTIFGVSVMSSLLCAMASAAKAWSMQWCAWRERFRHRWWFAHGANGRAGAATIWTTSSAFYSNVTSL